MKIPAKRLSIDVDLPAGCSGQLAGIPHLLEFLLPDIKEVAEGGRGATRRFNVDDTRTVVSVKPVETRTIRSNPDIRREGGGGAIDVDGHMRMHMRTTLLCTQTGNLIYRGIRCVGRGLILYHRENDEADHRQRHDSSDADRRDALRPGSALPLFIPPALFLAPSFLPRKLTRTLLTHRFDFPFLCISSVTFDHSVSR